MCSSGRFCGLGQQRVVMAVGTTKAASTETQHGKERNVDLVYERSGSHGSQTCQGQCGPGSRRKKSLRVEHGVCVNVGCSSSRIRASKRQKMSSTRMGLLGSRG